MMHIELFGSHKTITNSLVKLSLEFYAEQLISKRLRSAISLRVFFKTGMLKATGLEASCMWEDRNIRAREFMFQVDMALSKRKLFLSLAHEMVHVKQYATGQMKHYLRHRPDISWLGKFVDDTKVPYDKLPWEQEAWNLETSLYKQFLSSRKGKDEKT
jgi:hypothetical protein